MESENWTIKCSSAMKEEMKTRILDLSKDKDYWDFVIKMEDEEIKCHKLTLAASSAYFRRVLRTSGANEMVMVAGDGDDVISAETVKMELDYLHGDEISVSGVDQALAMLDLARLWQLDDEFVEQLEQFVVTTPALTADNCLIVRDHLIRQDHGQRVVALVDRFISEHFADVTNSECFTRVQLQYVLKLLDSDCLNVEDEKEVFESALRWVNVDRENRERHMSEVMRKVRMGAMELVDVALIAVDLTRRHGEQLDEFILVNLNYLKSKRNGVIEQVDMKSVNRRKCGTHKTLMCISGLDNANNALKSIVMSVDNGKSWVPGSDMTVGRFCFSATVCSGYVFVVGGQGYDGTSIAFCEKFNITTKQWEKTGYLPAPRSEHSVSAVGQQLYVTGGVVVDEGTTDSVLTLDVGQEVSGSGARWTQATPMRRGRFSHVSASLNDVLYVIGGGFSPKSCDMFDPKTNVWKPVSSTMYDHQNAGSCTDGTRRIYVAGDDDRSAPSHVEVYDVITDQWSVLQQPLRTPRYAPTLTFHHDSVFVVGGRDKDYKNISDVEVLNTLTNSWALASPLPAPRCLHATVSF